MRDAQLTCAVQELGEKADWESKARKREQCGKPDGRQEQARFYHASMYNGCIACLYVTYTIL